MRKITTSILTLFTVILSFQATAQITESFETTSLSGWTLYSPGSGDPGFIRTSAHPHGGSYSFYHDDANITSASTSWMVSPSHTCGATDELKFWYYQNFTASYYNYSGVWISTASNNPVTNPGDFTEIQELNASAPGGFSEDTWTEFTTSLAAYNGQIIYIAFKYTGDYEHELYIDDFSVVSTGPCLDPSALTSSSVNAGSEDLGWTENGTATQWDIELGTAGFSPTGTPTANNVSSNPYTYTGLSPNTSYDYYVRADCGGVTSAWIGPFNFTTPTAPCTDPTTLTVSNITSTYADLGWTETGFASLWDIELGVAGFAPTGIPTANNVNTNLYTYSGLTGSTSYDYYVRADCGGTTSNWVGPFNFNTSAPLLAGTDCANPFAIAALPYIQTGMTTSGFGNDYSTVDGCGSFTSSLNNDDFVIEYTPLVDECIKITLTNTLIGGYMDVAIHAFNSCPLNPGSCMGNVVYDSMPYFPNIPLTGGNTYYFIVSSRSAPTPFDLRMESVPCVDESNDECVNAITLVQNNFCNPTVGSFWTATDDGILGSCESTFNKDDVWYKFVATTTDPIILVERFGTIAIALYDQPSPCPPLASSDIDCLNNTNQLQATGLTIGNTYYIEVSNYASHFDYTFNICVYDFPPQPPCGANPAADDDCAWATMIANLDGYCGNTSGAYTIGDVPASFCGSVDNNSWLSFVAADTEASLAIYTYNCTVGEGIQMQIYETFDCVSFNPVSNCWNPGVESNGIIIANNLTIGNTYYLMIDGFNGDDCDYTIGGMSGISLPIELADISAECFNASSIINWSTYSEINNDYFEVQRSRDAVSFESLDVLDGAGNSNNLLSYSFTDPAPYDGVSYYRLKQVDFDGKFSYSTLTVLDCDNINTVDVNAIYNSLNSEIRLVFKNELSKNNTLEIRNSLGQLVHSQTLEQGLHKLTVPFKQYSIGHYLVSIVSENSFFVQKIIKH